MLTRSLIFFLQNEETNKNENSIKKHLIHSLKFQMTEEVNIKLHDVFVILNVDTITNYVEGVKRKQQII